MPYLGGIQSARRNSTRTLAQRAERDKLNLALK